MAFETAIKIYDAIENIKNNKYLLPAFQRKFVWTEDQIEKLFDSLMKGYPISSMLFWNVDIEKTPKFKFYQFLNKYVERHKIHNVEYHPTKDFTAILDGQQRLTALYIGLCGSYASHKKNKSWEQSEVSFPTKHLYLNITKTNTDEENDKEFEFSFIDKSESQEQILFMKDNCQWFKIGHILSLPELEDLDDYCSSNNITGMSRKILSKLNAAIFSKSHINFYLEKDPNPDKAVNIFIRINSGGTPLNKATILWSMAIANWQESIREDFETLQKNISNKDFVLTEEYVLKSFLYLFHKNVKAEIINFNNNFMKGIENQWQRIQVAITNLFDLLQTFGFTQKTLTSFNATLPILYYLYHKNIYENFSTKKCYENERQEIKKWLLGILLKKVFGASADNILKQSRGAFTDDIEENKLNKNISNFPASEINNKIKRYSEWTDSSITELMYEQKGSAYSFLILATLYPKLNYKNNDFHQDHLHPIASFGALKQEDKDWKIFNSILNLQMLDANENQSKNDMLLVDWVEEQTKDKDRNKFLKDHLIPDTNLELDNFAEFIEARKTLIINELKTILN